MIKYFHLELTCVILGQMPLSQKKTYNLISHQEEYNLPVCPDDIENQILLNSRSV